MTSRLRALRRASWPTLVLLFPLLLSLQAAARDITPPGGTPEPHGTLRVEGTFSIAAGQWKTFQFRRCAADADGHLVPFSCFGVQMGEINESHSVPTGLYLLEFWGSQTEVLVSANQTSTVTLKKIRILPSPEATEVSVFRDLTAPNEQMKIRRELAGSPELRPLCESAREGTPEAIDCKNVAQGDFSLGHFLFFDSRGGYSVAHSWRNHGRIQVGEPFREDHYVVLFDGTYIVRFKSLTTGEAIERFGIAAD